MAPLQGPASGNTNLQAALRLVGAPPTAPVRCSFAGANTSWVIPATTSLTASVLTVSCPTPFFNVAGPVRIAIVVDELDTIEASILFTVYETPRILSLQPVLISAARNQGVDVMGRHFQASGAQCVWTTDSGVTARVPATWLDANRTKCNVPEAWTTSVQAQLELSFNNVDVTQDGHRVAIVGTDTTWHATPTAVVARAGAVMTVTGFGFGAVDRTMPLLCNFSGIGVTTATVQTPSTLRCPVPMNVSTDALSSTLRIQLAEGLALWEVSCAVYRPLAVLTTTPTTGLAGARVTLQLRSTRMPLTSLQCLFGSTATTAHLINATTVVCVAPPVAAIVSQAVSLLVQGQPATLAPTFFTYLAPSLITSLQPVVGTAGTTVALQATSISPGTTILFDGVSATTTMLGATSVTCTVPALHTALRSTTQLSRIALSLDGAIYSLNTFPFQSSAGWTATSMAPTVVPTLGGRRISFTIDVVDVPPPTAELACRFGDAPGVIVVALSTTDVACVAPSWPTTETVSVSLQNATLGSFPLTYMDHTNATVTSISPPYGRPGTRLLLQRTLHVNASVYACIFQFVSGSTVRPMAAYNATTMTCQVPTLPPTIPVPVTIPVVIQALGVTVLSMLYTIVAPLMVFEVSPPCGSVSTLLHVYGSGFQANGTYDCVFATGATRATVVSTSEITCQPSRGVTADSTLSILDTWTNESVHTNGGFTIVAPPLVTAVQASQDVIFVECVVPDPAPASSIFCGFNNATAQVVGSWHSTGTVACPLPDAAQLRAITSVLLSWNGQEWSSGFAWSAPRLLQLSATRVAAGGSFTVTGAGLAPPGAAVCWIGAFQTPAIVQSPSRVLCQAPNTSTPLQNASVTISLDGGVTLLMSNLVLSVAAVPRITAVIPSFATTRGGTLLSVTGDGFPDAPANVSCRFGDVTTQGIRNGSALVLCSTPPFRKHGVVPISLDWASLENVFVSTNSIGLELVPVPIVTRSTTVPIALRLNGVDALVSSVSYTYAAVPTIVAPVVATGRATGLVLVLDTYFESDELTCLFDATRLVPGMGLNRTHIVCPRPFESVATVAVSNNGREFSAPVDIMSSTLALTALHPRVAPYGSAGVVTLHSTFNLATVYTCDVDATLSLPLTLLNTTTGTCIVPTTALATSHQISVASGGLISNALFYWLVPPPLMTSVNPVVGVQAGVTSVLHVSGTGFVDACDYVCFFNERYFSTGRWQATTLVDCPVPLQMSLGDYELQLWFSGERVASPNKTVYSVLPAPTLSGLAPVNGALQGGTTIELRGSAFPPNATCLFGHRTVVPTSQNATYLACAAPIAASPTTVAVAVALNGVLVSAARYYTYKDPPVLTSLASPTVVPWSFSGPVRVQVVDVSLVDTVVCRYHAGSAAVTVTGSVETTRIVSCPFTVLPSRHGRFELALSWNTHDWSSPLSFDVAPSMLLSHLAPTLALYPLLPDAMVRVFGFSLQAFSCAFRAAGTGSSIIVAAVAYSTTALDCPIPPQLVPDKYSVALTSIDGTLLSASQLSFVVASAPSVDVASPTGGDVRGSTPVVVRGVGFQTLSAVFWKCRFGELAVAATVVDDMTLSCLAPAVSAPQTISLSITWSDQLVQGGWRYTYYDVPHIASFQSLRPVTVGVPSSVQIQGDAFPVNQLSSVACALGTQPLSTMPAAYINSSTVVCHIPAVAIAGAYDLYVLWNGIDVSSSVPLAVVQPMTLRAVVPAVGFTVIEVLTLLGGPFRLQDPVECYYQGIYVAATVLNATAVSCAVRWSPGPSSVALMLTSNRLTFSNSVPFSYAPDARVHGMTPRDGVVGHRTAVRLEGRFPMALRASTLVCSFQGALSPAQVLSPSAVLCVAPVFEMATTVAVSLLYEGRVVPSPMALPILPRVSVVATRPAFVSSSATQPVSMILTFDEDISMYGLVCPKDVPLVVLSNRTGVCSNVSLGHRLGPQVLWLSKNHERIGPNVISEAGGALLHAVATPAPPQLSCRIDGHVVPGRRRPDGSFVCAAPPHAPGVVLVDVSFDAFASSSATRPIVYLARVHLHSIVPTFGLVAQYQDVVVRGTNFVPSTSWRCHFDAAVVHARVLNSSALQCTAPPRLYEAKVRVGVTWNDQERSSTVLDFEYLAFPTQVNALPSGTRGWTIALDDNATVRAYQCAIASPTTSKTTLVVATYSRPSVLLCPSAGIDAPSAMTLWYNGAQLPTKVVLMPDPCRRVVVSDSMVTVDNRFVTIYGQYSAVVPLSCAVNGTDLVPAISVDATSVQCVLPSMMMSPMVTVTLYCNDRPVHSVSVNRSLPASILSVSPNMTSSYVNYAGSVLSIRGVRLATASPVFCIFNSTTSTPVVASSSDTAQCQVPVLSAPGPVSLAIETSSGTFLVGHSWTVVAPPVVHDVTPQVVPIGSLVKLSGSHLGPTLLVMYGTSSSMSCTVLSDAFAHCPVPTTSGSYAMALSTTGGFQFQPIADVVVTATTSTAVVTTMTPTMQVANQTSLLAFHGALLATMEMLAGPRGPRMQCRLRGPVEVYANAILDTKDRISCSVFVAQPGIYNVSLVPFFADTAFELHVVSAPRRIVMTPVVANFDGSTSVTFCGAPSLPYGPRMHCVFGAAATAVSVLNASCVSCVAPAQPSGVLSAALYLDVDVPVSSKGLFSIMYVQEPAIVHIEPTVVAATTPTTVVVSGWAFPNESVPLMCVIQVTDKVVHTVAATNMTSRRVLCELPSLPPASVAQLGVAIDGVVYSNMVAMTVLPEWNTTQWQLEPTTGPLGGNYTVTIHGRDFPSGIPVQCFFGPVVAPGIVVSPERVLCRAPRTSLQPTVPLSLAFGSAVIETALTFTFTSPPVVFTVQPSSAWVASFQLWVHVHGAGLGFALRWECFFGAVRVAAVHLSSQLLACHAPALVPGNITLRVVGHDHIYYEKTIAVAPAPALATSRTLFGWRGTNIIVGGLHLAPVTSCRVGGLLVPAISSANNVSCVAPSGSGIVNVTLSVGDEPVPSAPWHFQYIAPMAISSIHPTALAIIDSSSTLSLYGNFSSAITSYQCRFGVFTTTVASVVSTSELKCSIPRLPLGPTPVTVFWDSSNAMPGPRLVFETLPPLAFPSLAPSEGPMAGGTIVRVQTRGLAQALNITCIFGSQWHAGSYDQVTRHVLCKTPPQANSGVVSVTLVVNHQTFATNLSYAYLAVPTLLSVQHSLDAMEQWHIAVTTSPTSVQRLWLKASDMQCLAVSTGIHTFGCVVGAPASSARLFVSVNGVDFKPSALALDLTAQAVFVDYVEPAFVPMNAPSITMSVHGAGLGVCDSSLQGVHCVCVFGASTTNATYVSSVLLQCPIPALLGAVPFTLGVNGSEYIPLASTSRTMHVAGDVAIEAATPTAGLATGGTIVSMSGVGFYPALGCWLDARVFVPAMVLNASFLVCTLPPQGALPTTVTVTLTTELHPNFVLAPQLLFEYLEAPLVTALWPSMVAMHPNATVSLTLTTSVPTVLQEQDIDCLFDREVASKGLVVATTRTTLTVNCSVPTLPNAGVATVDLVLSDQHHIWTGWSTDVIFGNTLRSVVPSYVPANSPVPITMHVLYDALDVELSCVFYQAVTNRTWRAPARTLGARAFGCLSPRVTVASVLDIGLELHGQTYTDNRVVLTVYLPPEGVGVQPSVSLLDGGAVVRLQGRRFFATPDLACQFGTTQRMPARLVSVNEVECTAPPLPVPSNVSVGVVFAGTLVNWLNMTIEYIGDVRILDVTPPNGPLGGNTSVVLSGAGLHASWHLQCVFELSTGDVLVPATIDVVHQTVSCAAPPVTSPETVTISLCTSADGMRLASFPNGYNYVYPMQVLSTFPARGIAGVAMLVDVHGVFLHPSIVCRINHATTAPAFFISENHARCAVPAMTSTSIVVLEVANNNHDFVLVTILPLDPPLNATTISPSNGPISGGTTLYLRGANVGQASLCRIDRIVTPARKINATMVACIAPPHPRGVVTVELSSNNAGYVMASVSYEYLVVPSVMAVEPPRGQVASRIVVRGSGFVDRGNHNVYCRFGKQALVLAHVHSSTRLECVVPDVPLTVVDGTLQRALQVEVSLNNGVDYSASGVTFEVLDAYHVRSLRPRTGSALGGTRIRLLGHVFRQAKQLACTFGSVVVPAVFISPIELQCVTPAHATGVVPVGLLDESDTLMALPATLTFEFTHAALIDSIVPSFGATTGGTTVSVLGRHIIFSTTLACRFDATTVPAVYVNASCVTCVAPAHAAGTVNVTLSSGGLSLSSVTFAYQALPVLSALLNRTAMSPLGGDVVSIVGTSLDGPATCIFDDGRASVPGTVLSLTTVTCIEPPRATASVATLYVLTPSGRSNVLSLPYFAPTEVWSIVPPFGSSDGGGRLRLYGIGFNQSRTMECAFSDDSGWRQTTPAIFVSPTEASCVSPNIPRVVSPTSLRVDVHHFGTTVTQLPGVFTALPPLQLHDVEPREADNSGGTIVAFRGAKFHPSSALACVFNASFVPATFENTSFATCRTPVHVPGTVAVGLTNNGIDVVWRRNFTFRAPVYVTSVVPTTGETTGSTTVRITGTSFFSAMQLQCTFDATAVLATFVSPTLATCDAPATNDRYTSRTVRLAVGLANHAPKTVVAFTYVALERILSVTPGRAWSVGGTVVTVSTQNVLVSSNATCWFGATAVQASKVTASTMVCASPLASPTSLAFAISSTASAPASVDPFMFEILPTPVVTAMPVATAFVNGGSDLTLYGEHLESVSHCQIGSAVVPAYATSTRLRCVAPPQPSPGTYTVSLQSSFATLTTPWNVTYASVPVPPPLPVFVEPAVRTDRPAIASLFPPTVSSSGGTVVTVVGSRFQNVPTLQCVFGTVVVPASYRSPSSLVCISPRHVPMRLLVEVSNDGVLASISGRHVIVANDAVQREISPVFGNVGTRIRVVGNHFSKSPLLVCRFGLAVVPAEFVSPTEVTCVAPDPTTVSLSNGRDVVIVHTSNNNASFTSHGSFFTYAPTPVVTSLWPHIVSQAGTGSVTLRGHHFRPYPVSCVWNRLVVVPATVHSSTLLQCAVPPSLALGQAILQLSILNGLDASPPTTTVTIVATVTVISVAPASAPSLTNTTLVHVYGTNFRPTIELSCQVDSTMVPAIYVNATTVQCLLPPHPIGRVDLGVTTNGIEFALPVAFSFVPDVRVARVRPTFTLLPGQTPVFVQGQHFQNVSTLGCRFGDLFANATYVSPELLICVAPSRVGNLLAPATTVAIDVTVDGIAFSNSGVLFEYRSSCPHGAYCLGHDVLASPNGTYIGADAQNFTLCAPGTFQPRAELSTPTTLCNQGHYCSRGTKTLNVREWEASSNYVWNNETGLLVFNDSTMTWPIVARVVPATGARRPTIRQCYWTRHVFALVPEKPYVCPLGTYCLKGATTLSPLANNFSTPQACYAGFFCPRGSYTPEGMGPCPTGYFCPNPTDALLCPCGMYCPGVGNTKPIACYPGTYQPATGQPTCVLCPIGSICPGWNNTAPTLCPAGFVCSAVGLSHPVQLCPAGFYCNEGTWTLDPSELSPLRPYPCATGTFCLAGIEAPLTIDWLPNVPAGATARQTCTEGAFCLEGTTEATLCYPGHYCPPGSTFPVVTPQGTFSGDDGAIAPMLCFPGTFAVFASSTDCQVCPAGYTCPGYGNYMPTLCPQGTYRSIADSITCRLCPAGTWSPKSGVADISYCEPCPAGRVCGVQGMNNLTQSIICPSGYVCGEATTLEMQYMHECPAGYVCGAETTLATAFDHLCPPGSTCLRGTKDTESTRYMCPVGAFCPRGTADGDAKECQCPSRTTSLPGSDAQIDCSITEISVCDKDPTKSYYPQFTYTFQGDTKIFNSWATSNPTGEVEVVTKVLPVNASASAPGWHNGTIDVMRACPHQLSATGGELLTVIGRNFLDTNELTCEFRLVDSIVFLSVPATYVNGSRVQCRAPPMTLNGAAAVAAKVHVSNYGVHISATGANVTYSASPPAASRCGYSAAEEGPYPPELGWFALRGLSEIHMSFDLRHIPVDMVYDEHFKIAVYVAPSLCNNAACNAKRIQLPLGAATETSPCLQPLLLPSSLTSTAFQQHDVLNLTFLALEDMIVKPEIHITYGLFASAADLFLNSTSVEIRSPRRAFNTAGIVADSRPLSPVISFEEELVPRDYAFLAVYRRAIGLNVPYPMNLPPRFSQLERGRVLQTNVVSEKSPQMNLLDTPVPGVTADAYWTSPFSTLAKTADMVAKYRETFQGLSPDNASYDMTNVMLPYLPYFSHCRGYGRYMTIFDLLESDAHCQLPALTEQPASWTRRALPPLLNQDDVVVVGPTDILQDPTADYCYRDVACQYEEDLRTVAVNPRWFEASTLTSLFEMVNEPVTYQAYSTGSQLYKTLLAAGNSDVFVPVLVDRTAADVIEGGCTIQCFPRKLTLEIAYYQVTLQLKRLIFVKLIYDKFDLDATRTDYALHVEYRPLGYLELLINFAFEPSMYITLFNVMGLVAWVGCAIAWIINRLMTRIRDPPKLYYLSYLSLIAPPPTIGAILATLPLSAIIGSFYLLLNGDIAFSITTNYPGAYPYWLLDNVKSQYNAALLDPSLVTTMRHGRTGFCFLLLGCYLMHEAAVIFVPKTISISERAAEEKSDKSDALLPEEDDSLWKPTLWMRSSFIFASVLQALFLTVIVEFSFWNDFPNYMWYILFMTKLLSA
ncbi:hypothetical protein SPRG_10953 [Saprolegnia parasitica CBS 223.65]|uniref:IPT/TIG domain-containing protein n=1 Tax=Saprolegnia parasitica (strain CBS 223.65) TaxID=695850 RepID=A0A067BZ68_SAPPC|nr:hypothetical protein SPRG_10953 [Saprolegnia parasitica CBS 223.65]KDO22135.1 hypothetical protein SPRG_10953 [Saprolegnia parasitica CBS 223.65]|eukprot:XP_012207173.1 hypothetical protein SPRG_10953 [Saprolegnia parasitica CBS 223.65]